METHVLDLAWREHARRAETHPFHPQPRIELPGPLARSETAIAEALDVKDDLGIDNPAGWGAGDDRQGELAGGSDSTQSRRRSGARRSKGAPPNLGIKH